MAAVNEETEAGEVPCPPMFATETMAELSARQGRVADAVAIYRHLLGTAAADGVEDARVEKWRARVAELEAAAGSPSPKVAPAPAPAPRAPALPSRTTAAPVGSLVIRDPVRSGQVVYAQGRDLIVIAPVHPGAQLLADGNIHVYGALKGRAVAGAQGRRDVEVFCLSLEAELVGVDAGYLLCDDLPPALWGTPARVFLTPDGTCAAVALSAGGQARWRTLSGLRTP
jgi:septum site-determining protein MinC